MHPLTRLLGPVAVVALFVSGCGDDDAADDAAAAVAVPDDPVAAAQQAAVAFDTTVQSLAERYSFELERGTGDTALRVTGLHLGTRTTAIRSEAGTTVESVVIDGAAMARTNGAAWLFAELPTDQDPLAPLRTATEVAVTGYEVTVSYPGPLLGFVSDWVTAAVETGADGSLTIRATEGGLESVMVFAPVAATVTIEPPTS